MLQTIATSQGEKSMNRVILSNLDVAKINETQLVPNIYGILKRSNHGNYTKSQDRNQNNPKN